MLKRRFENIVTYGKHGITNAASESINSKIEWVKYTARGSRNKTNFVLRPTSTVSASMGSAARLCLRTRHSSFNRYPISWSFHAQNNVFRRPRRRPVRSEPRRYPPASRPQALGPRYRAKYLRPRPQRTQRATVQALGRARVPR